MSNWQQYLIPDCKILIAELNSIKSQIKLPKITTITQEILSEER